MAEYIDREELVRELECGIRAGNYEDGYEKYMHINDMDDCVDTVKYFDKVDVVEREKIDKAIEEMTKLLASTNNIALENRTYDCIEILKRNIGD
jgi:hypothetical protein